MCTPGPQCGFADDLCGTGERCQDAALDPCLHRHRDLGVYQRVIAPSMVERALPVHLVRGDAGAHTDGLGDPDDVRLPR